MPDKKTPELVTPELAPSTQEIPHDAQTAEASLATHDAISSAMSPEALPQPLSVFETPIIFSKEGPRKSMQYAPSTSIHINITKYSNIDQARRAGMLAATHLHELRESLGGSTRSTLSLLGTRTRDVNTVLLFKGIQKLKGNDPEMAALLANATPAALTLTQQFDYACQQYLLTGKIPDGLSDYVSEAFKKLTKNSRNALDIVVQENRTLESSITLYEKYISAARNTLKIQEKAEKETESADYTPPPFSGEMEPMDPESVQFRVEPFLEGYYRGQIFRYDPQQHKLVADPSPSTIFNPQSLPEDLDDLTHYTFRGTYLPGKECILPLHEDALPLPLTLEPKNFRLVRSTRGTFILEPLEPKDAQTPQSITQPTPFAFTFVLAKTEDNQINDEPDERDTATLEGPMSATTQEFIEKLRANTLTTQKDKARSVVSRTRQILVYPKKDQREEMDQLYAQAGNDLIQTIENHTIADCHWSNIAAGESGKRLDIPWRVPTGYFVQRIPDCDFAAIGGTGHAWSEAWNEDKYHWDRLDATPPQQKDDDEKEEEEPMDDDVENSDALMLTEEEMDKLMEEIQKENTSGAQATEDEIAQALFHARTNVNPADWLKVKRFLDSVNETQISPESQIPEKLIPAELLRERVTAPHGTLEREWQKLFCLIFRHRMRVEKSFRGPVRQSEGSRERDTTDIYIDVMSGESDPMGYEMESTRMRTHIDITEFEEDSIVDLTSSMNTTDDYGNTMRIEQKKIILSMLYQIMRLNEKLNDSRVKNGMREPVQIGSEIYSIHGTGRNDLGNFACLKSRDEQITEGALVHLANILDKTSPGAGDLVSALRTYRESITAEIQAKIKKGKFVKMLTLYSDGNTWCATCGAESCNTQMHRAKVREAQDEVGKLRAMGVIVQGIGFTQAGSSIKLICADPQDPQAAICVNDTSKAIFARQQMLQKHLQKI